MKRFIGFEHGMGIDGWLTNYKCFHVLPQERRLCLAVGDMEHFATYITEADIAYIASLGMTIFAWGLTRWFWRKPPVYTGRRSFSI